LHPHFDYMSAIKNYTDQIAEKGAIGAIVYNSNKDIPALTFSKKDRTPVSKIPVVFITEEAYKKHLADAEQSYNVQFKTKIVDQYRTSQNVIAFLDRGAAKTVILGA